MHDWFLLSWFAVVIADRPTTLTSQPMDFGPVGYHAQQPILDGAGHAGATLPTFGFFRHGLVFVSYGVW